MRRIGTVARVAQGLAVARSPDDSRPEVGAEAVDESLEAVGRVVDVIGPVSRPYIVVSSGDRAAAELLNERLYTR